MKAENLREATRLMQRWKQASEIIHNLNEINGGAAHYAFPCEAFEFVDNQLAAKGVLSLMVEAVAVLEKEIGEIGVELPR